MQFLGTKRMPTFQGAHKAEIQLQRTAPSAAAAYEGDAKFSPRMSSAN